ncbi:MAG: chitobiase/beta-hexosaminidase C-terminal domain-containing protein, partial [Oscillospiraceae bacterium]|nr:chitobiase/beta-hexosaminidase C-terminal domain-containing protein [Oscillospiraceae bacterium]
DSDAPGETDATPTPAPTPTPTPTPEIAVTGIEISGPTNTTLKEGAGLDVSGLVVKAVYSDGSEVEVNDYTLSGYDKDKVEQQKITVHYKEFTAEFTVTVTGKKLAGISIDQKPNKRSYVQGDALDLKGMVVTAIYDNNTSETITNYKVSGYLPDTAGMQTVTVEYGGFTALFTVTVASKQTSSDGAAEAPKINITSVIGGKTVELMTTTSGGVIRYTDDGTIPNENSKLYTGTPIEITETTTIKAITVKSGMQNSSVTSGKISVSKVEPLTVSHTGGKYALGTTITLKTITSGTTIYYTTDGNIPTPENGIKYSGSIVISKNMTLKAIAVKNGYKTSAILEEIYTVPTTVLKKSTVSIGSATAAAGDLVSVPVYIFSDSDVSNCYFVVNYDAKVFEYASITPAEGVSSLDLFASSDNNGKIAIRYMGSAIESGEICSINLNALSSAYDGIYELTVDKSEQYDTMDGEIMLTGSVNSNIEVSAETVLTDKEGNDITNKSQVKDEITASVTFEDLEDGNDGEPLTVNVILAIYDRGGALVSLAAVETDVSDANSVFTHTIKIPENVEVGSIKMMIWRDLNDMAPCSKVSSVL